ncbi:MAG TPA: hypothetical protein VF688_08390 [Allosphingosinicella sp.]|jgi:hypothetical protein
MDRTDSRLAHSPEPASDDVASPFNSSPAWPSDRLAFEPVRLRYRTDGLTPEKQRAYVEALADCGIVREAASRIGVSEQCINRVRRRTDARSFDGACEAAHMIGARRLRSIAIERAIEGTLKGHYYHGERVGEERVHDNRLLIYLLGKTEHLLEPTEEVRAICGNWEPCMDALEQGRPIAEVAEEPSADEFSQEEVWQTDEGEWRTSFPPPEGFDGFEEGEWDGVSWYCRALTARELAAIEAERSAERSRACARRDRFFGFPAVEISSSREAEPSEPSEPSELFASLSRSDGEGGGAFRPAGGRLEDGTGCEDSRRAQHGGGVTERESADQALEPPASAPLPLHHATRGPPPHAQHGEAETADDPPPSNIQTPPSRHPCY